MQFERGSYYLFPQQHKAYPEAVFSPNYYPWKYPGENATTTITLNVTLSSSLSATPSSVTEGVHSGLFEVIVVHEDDFEAIGGSYQGRSFLCCTYSLVQAGACTEAGAVMFNRSPRVLDSYLRHATQLGSHSVVTVEAVLKPQLEGVHWLFFVDCTEFNQDPVYYEGCATIENPYGFLPADHWGYYPLFIALLCGYSLFAIAWVALLLRADAFHPMHYIPLAISLVALVENALLLANLQIFNRTADGSLLIIFFATLMSATKRAIALFSFLLLGQGFPMATTRPNKIEVWCCYSLITFIYFSLVLFSDTLSGWNEQSSSYPLSAGFLFATIVPMAMISALIYGWVIVSHLNTLRIFNRTTSEKAYRRFLTQFRIIVAFGLSMTIFSLVETISVFRVTVYVPYWPFWWLWSGVWQIFFFAPFILISFLWPPSLEFLYVSTSSSEEISVSGGEDDIETPTSQPEDDPENQPDDDEADNYEAPFLSLHLAPSGSLPAPLSDRIRFSSSDEDGYNSDESLKMFGAS